jgi:hypothetical protein
MSSAQNIDLGSFTVDDAKALVDKVFIVTADGNDYALKLFEASPIELHARRRSQVPKRAPFSIFFLGPREPVLPQAMYSLRSDDAIFESLFIVPLGRDEEGAEYEAVFA